MLAAFKETLFPVIVYLLVMGTCLIAVVRRPEWGLWVYVVLVMFPQFWYPTQDFPLGAMTLTLLVISVISGTLLRPAPDAVPAPSTALLLTVIAYTFVCVWTASIRYKLPMPVSGANPILGDWKNFAMMIALYWVAYRALRDESHLKTLVVLFVVVLLLTSWREYRNFYGGSSFSYQRRAAGTFDLLGMGANHFGAFVSNVAAMALALFSFDRHKMRRRLYLFAFLAALYPLFFSYSRGAYVALLGAAAVVGVLRYRMLIVLLVALAFTWQVILPDTVVERMGMTESADGEVEESAAMRLVVWNLAQDLFAEYPIFGIGFNGFFFATEGLPLRNAHNYYLTVAAEQGIVGVLLLAAVLVRAFLSGWRLFRSGQTDFLRGLGLAFLSYTTSMALTNVFGDRYSQLEMGSYFWLLFGATERALVISRKLPEPEGHSATIAMSPVV